MTVASPTDRDAAALARALELAERGRGHVSPNPMVGCVIHTASGELAGEGYHARIGDLHAEAAAIEDARGRGADVRGATLYVTLEPCAHHGRQPPCTEAIIAAGIAEVVIASGDPSSKADGEGPRRLENAGVRVRFSGGDAEHAARALNQPFRKHSRTGRPLVVLKSAMTLDGRTATASGDSRWISGERSRALVHEWRAELDAVAVGIGTALADDPLLTARDVADPGAVDGPRRVVFDSAARLPLGSRLLATAREHPLTILTGPAATPERIEEFRSAGAEVVELPSRGPAALGEGLDALGELGVTSILLEGGATLAGAFRDADELDELRLFIAPLVLGGADAHPVLGGRGATTIDDALRAGSLRAEASGEDLLVRATLREW
ncbi:bifunctional diaminohydroxyphosphoribosylaminopyrimidine deaminase/5-amino-6-(5-phosphoribosylamino)uracil reductase RibD [Thermoleophilia bacterium SCSIO 60948]|nr:bifunctional diaminohydroxyphosphoribosylaminopyrimidine deaminase/5-amino-6-(5-phosphoribosylamino)uracil reductase RibD [Thermoleophilia bacterium SCSIO 60948]